MEFEQLRQSWDRLGATDPRWAILSEPGREGGKWDDASFWQSGVSFVDWVASHLAALGMVPQRQRALDFGCGHGRLTQALANYFDEVVGVDIAESMLVVARAANQKGARVSYVHNPRPDLAVFGDASFDFVLTVLVLQHMRTEYSAVYLREFLRVLRPGGYAFFQIPIEPLAPLPTPRRPATAAPGPISPAAVAATTSIAPPQVILPASAWQWFRVSVHNRGDATLHARKGPGCVEIGARFLNPEGRVVGGTTWTALPNDVAPGERVSLLLPMRMPAVAGNLALVVLPCVARSWCEHAANVAATSRTTVHEAPPSHVVAELPPPEPKQPGPTPDGCLIEVYGTPLADLHTIVTAAGGELRDVALDAWAGYEWISAHCVVQKV